MGAVGSPSTAGWPIEAIGSSRWVGSKCLRPKRIERSTAPGASSPPGSSTCTTTPICRRSCFPEMPSTLRQGVTSVVVGNCGSSPWPLVAWDEAVGLAYGEPGALPRPAWTGWGDYLDAIDAARPAVNIATLDRARIGATSGARASSNGAPSTSELDRMRGLVRDADRRWRRRLVDGLDLRAGHLQRDRRGGRARRRRGGRRRALRLAHPRRGPGPVLRDRRGARDRPPRRVAGAREPPQVRVLARVGARRGTAAHPARGAGRNGRSVSVRRLELLACLAAAAVGARRRHRLDRRDRRRASPRRGRGRRARIPVVGRRRGVGSHRARDGATTRLAGTDAGRRRRGARRSIRSTPSFDCSWTTPRSAASATR